MPGIRSQKADGQGQKHGPRPDTVSSSLVRDSSSPFAREMKSAPLKYSMIIFKMINL